MPVFGIQTSSWNSNLVFRHPVNCQRLSFSHSLCNQKQSWALPTTWQMQRVRCVVKLHDGIVRWLRLAIKGIWSCHLCSPFCKLVNHNISGYIVRLLCVWCSKHCVKIQWAGIVFGSFNIISGVQQEGILSSSLFRIYVDELSVHLQTVRAGCLLGRQLDC